MTQTRRPLDRSSVVRRTAVLAAAVLISMGAQGAIQRAGPPSAARTEAPVVPADGVIATTGDAVVSGTAVNAAFDPAAVDLSLSLVASGFSNPVLVTNAGDGSGRLFVVEQTGRVKVIKSGSVLAKPFLDLHAIISTGGERGLLGLAFHPRYPTVPYVYVNFTTPSGATAITRYKVSSNPDAALPGSGVRILTIGQPYANHNGGNLAFGPDGYLYIGMGDGGSAGDPGNRAQSTASLLGKILRIDVDHPSGTKRYRSPASNPYVGRAGLDEIWSRGLRNPWRWSFDRATGDLWIGDVGQGRYEEVNRSKRLSTTPAGKNANYGWRVMEGRACYRPSTGCSTSGKHLPEVVYSHAVSGDDNCSVTGGFVYRGSASPVLAGGYLYGDYCSGRMWVVSATAASPMTPTLVWSSSATPHLAISSFGEDEAGEIYVCDLGGRVYRVNAT